MTKKEITTILARATKEEAVKIAAPVREAYPVQIMKQPQKTLVMVKVRESIQRSLFYLGEVLACECMVMVNGVKGSSILAGDDFDKVLAAAVIDATAPIPFFPNLIRNPFPHAITSPSPGKGGDGDSRTRLLPGPWKKSTPASPTAGRRTPNAPSASPRVGFLCGGQTLPRSNHLIVDRGCCVAPVMI